MKCPLIIFIAMFAIGCRKQDIRQPQQGSGTFYQSLKDSLNPADFSTIKLSEARQIVYPNGITLMRLMLPASGDTTSFILLDVSTQAGIKRGRKIRFVRNENTSGEGVNGSLIILSLNGLQKKQYTIKNGYAISNDSSTSARTSTVPGLTPVVVTAYVNHSHDLPPIIMMNWLAMFNQNINIDINGGGGSAYYAEMINAGSGGGTSTGNWGSYTGFSEVAGLNMDVEIPKLLDFEFPEYDPGIEVDDYISCFGRIPDVGSTCSVEILTDIPVDNEPSTLFNWSTSSPGHTFLRITKSNMTQLVQQSIGFYPEQAFKTLNNGSIPSKMMDNGRHEYNASLKMDVTPQELHVVLAKLHTLAHFKDYDIDDYNCTDFALEVFNSIRYFNYLNIPQMHIPNATLGINSNTPQGLYLKLKEMKTSNSVEASKVELPVTKRFVNSSDGPCQ